ncbi:hypothetical protein [Phocaeicola sp.]
MELTKKNIEEYINRFLDGETTNAEEQAIYRFFREGDVPAHLKEYEPMFAWYEGGMQGEPKPVTMEEPKIEKKKRFDLRRIPVTAWSAGIAAMLVVSLGLGLLFYSDNSKEIYVEDWACYEGSYIEVGGKRITDIKQILPLILEEQAVAEQKEKIAEQRIREMEKKEKQVKEKEMMVN